MTYDCASAPTPDEIEWKRIEAGEYETTDGRFHAFKTWNRTYGHHWCLVDRAVSEYSKSVYRKNTLKECIGVAKTIVKNEKEYLHGDQAHKKPDNG